MNSPRIPKSSMFEDLTSKAGRLVDELAEKPGKMLDRAFDTGRATFSSSTPPDSDAWGEYRTVQITCTNYERVATKPGRQQFGSQGDQGAIFFVIILQLGQDSVTVSRVNNAVCCSGQSAAY